MRPPRPGAIAVRLTQAECHVTEETNRPPRFLGNPKVTAPTSETPAGPPSQASKREQARPPLARTAGAPTTRPISGLNGPARTHAVYASPDGSPHQDARLASGCWPDSTGWALGPLGSSERFLRCFLHRFPPFPGLPWRKRASVRHIDRRSERVLFLGALMTAAAGTQVSAAPRVNSRADKIRSRVDHAPGRSSFACSAAAHAYLDD
jgi:hypothetical protein